MSMHYEPPRNSAFKVSHVKNIVWKKYSNQTVWYLTDPIDSST